MKGGLGREIWIAIVSGAVSSVAGAVAGWLIASQEPVLKHWFADLTCNVDAKERQAGKFQAEAKSAGTESQRLFENANKLFAEAEKCGSRTARARLGVAYCEGWGVKKDVSVGRLLLIDSIREDINFRTAISDLEICKER